MKKIDYFYVDLDEVESEHMNPLFTLMSESELLAQGLEQRHMGIFSKSALKEIKAVQ